MVQCFLEIFIPVTHIWIRPLLKVNNCLTLEIDSNKLYIIRNKPSVMKRVLFIYLEFALSLVLYGQNNFNK